MSHAALHINELDREEQQRASVRGDRHLRSYDAPTKHKGAEISQWIFPGWIVATKLTPECHERQQNCCRLGLLF